MGRAGVTSRARSPGVELAPSAVHPAEFSIVDMGVTLGLAAAFLICFHNHVINNSV